MPRGEICTQAMIGAHFTAQQLIPQWPAPAMVRAFTTLRHPLGHSQPPFDHLNLGARCGDDSGAVLSNRALLQREARLPSPPRWLDQVHGIAVQRFSALDPHAHASDEPAADAAVTDAPGVVLAVLTADCLPVVFCTADGREVAVAHAGWRGLCGGVLEATVAALHTPASQVLAWLGPAAGPNAYEVGAEVRDAFLARDAKAEDAFVATRPGHWLCDLYRLARQRLHGVGVAQVFGGEHCTLSDSQRFFSHRRDQVSGRMATLAWIARDTPSHTP
jgi:YfiH family protein